MPSGYAAGHARTIMKGVCFSHSARTAAEEHEQEQRCPRCSVACNDRLLLALAGII